MSKEEAKTCKNKKSINLLLSFALWNRSFYNLYFLLLYVPPLLSLFLKLKIFTNRYDKILSNTVITFIKNNIAV